MKCFDYSDIEYLLKWLQDRQGELVTPRAQSLGAHYVSCKQCRRKIDKQREERGIA